MSEDGSPKRNGACRSINFIDLVDSEAAIPLVRQDAVPNLREVLQEEDAARNRGYPSYGGKSVLTCGEIIDLVSSSSSSEEQEEEEKKKSFEAEDVEVPDLGGFFNQFPHVSIEDRIHLCRTYASHMSRALQSARPTKRRKF